MSGSKQITALGAWILALAATALATTPARAQSRPFPTSGHYGHGAPPAAVTPSVVLSSYNHWKAKYLLADCGTGGYYRVDNATGDASTFSEGQGYGMVLTAYFGDKVAFDGLWAFAQKNFNANRLMGWHVTCSGFTSADGGSDSATDADTDIGFALLVAAAQWGGTYAEQAKDYLATLKARDFTTCAPTGRTIPTAGDWQGGDACSIGGGTNTSYWMPAYYRVFQTFTGDPFWGKTADDVVALYTLAADVTTGLLVNDVDQNGAAVPGDTYDYNTCRLPWRAVLDYVWFGTTGTKQVASKLTGWADGVGLSNIVDGYNANGTPTGQYTGMNEFVGGFAAGAMASTQSLSDAFGAYFVGIDDDNGTYYGASLRTLYLLALSGDQWQPFAGEDAGGGGIDASVSDSGGNLPGTDGGSVTDAGVLAFDAAARDAGEADGAKWVADAAESDGAARAADASATPSEDGGGPAASSTRDPGGCSCSLAPVMPARGGAAWAAFGIGVAAWRRRRRSRASAVAAGSRVAAPQDETL